MKRTQALRLRRLAYGLAVLFFVMAIGGKMITGAWPFDGSIELAFVTAALGVVFHVAGMRRFAPLPDPSSLLDQALQLASTGHLESAIAVLNKTIEQNPGLWQAHQYRGELYLFLQNDTAAVRDLDEAIRLAPREQHLYQLRNRAIGASDAISNCGTRPEIRDSGVR